MNWPATNGSTVSEVLIPIAPFLADKSVTEVMFNGPSEIFIERERQLSRTDVSFGSTDALMPGAPSDAPVRRGRSMSRSHSCEPPEAVYETARHTR